MEAYPECSKILQRKITRTHARLLKRLEFNLDTILLPVKNIQEYTLYIIYYKTWTFRPYKKKILVLRHRRTLKIRPDETFLSYII